MNGDKQLLLLEYLASQPDTYAVCKSIVLPDYFSPEYRQVVELLHDFYDLYSSLPPPAVIKAETGLDLQTRSNTRAESEYAMAEIERFCQRRALERAVIGAPALIAAGKYGDVEAAVKQALQVSLTKDLGISYYDDPLARLERELQDDRERIPLPWPEVNDAIGGGGGRGEMLMFTASSGGGKSIAMSNVASFVSQCGYNVVYLSLELSHEMVSHRLDTMNTGISTVAWKSAYQTIAAAVAARGQTAGKLQIKRFSSGTNTNAFRGYLKELELQDGWRPDVIVVDYLDLVGPNETSVNKDNVHLVNKLASEQVRDLGADYDAFIVTASQLNRGGTDIESADDFKHSHIAGGMSKINTVDWWIGMLMTPAMKIAGEMNFVMLKTRSSDALGRILHLGWDNNTLMIVPRSRNGIDEAEQQDPRTLGGRSLNDILTM